MRRSASIWLDKYFYPRSPCGERRQTKRLKKLKRLNFYPRSPCGERPTKTLALRIPLLFLSTLSLRRATCQALPPELRVFHFYPRSPCGERHRYGRPIDVQLVFLSTLSLRRATFSVFASPFSIFYFYPRSPCGERRDQGANSRTGQRISIHALLAESDVE